MLEKHPIRVNHIGFYPNVPKRFILVENPEHNMTFTIDLIEDARFKEAFSGELVEKIAFKNFKNFFKRFNP